MRWHDAEITRKADREAVQEAETTPPLKHFGLATKGLSSSYSRGDRLPGLASKKRTFLMILRHEAEGLPRGAKVNVLSGKCAVITKAPVAEIRPVFLP